MMYEQSAYMDFLTLLPREIVELILQYFDIPDLFSVSLVCKDWKQRVDTSNIWRRFCHRDGILIEESDPVKQKYLQLANRLKLMQSELIPVEIEPHKQYHLERDVNRFGKGFYCNKVLVCYGGY